jgi:hypothetical protein
MYISRMIEPKSKVLAAFSKLFASGTQGDILLYGYDKATTETLIAHCKASKRMVNSYAETAAQYQELTRVVSAKHNIITSVGDKYGLIVVFHWHNLQLFKLLQMADVVVSNVPFRGETAHSILRVNAGDNMHITAYSNTLPINNSAGSILPVGDSNLTLF